MPANLDQKLDIRDIPLRGDLRISMSFVQGGRFQIGDESGVEGGEWPVHQAEVDDFWMARYPVSQALWIEIMGEKIEAEWKGVERPMESISRDDSQEFVRRLNYELGLKGDNVFRLPYSAEWEFAARGGIYSKGHRFAGSGNLRKVGWSDENSFGKTHPYGLKLPNELGLYYMSGGLWEWVEDWYDHDYYASCAKNALNDNPKGPSTGDSRVLRGGSWFNEERDCDVAIRYEGGPDWRDSTYGLRLSRTAL